jgi:uncharacterized protein (DUF362 family)
VSHLLERRKFIPLAGLGVMSGTVGMFMKPEARPQYLNPVAVVKAPSYDVDLLDTLQRGFEECGVPVRGRKVLLKPNMVEYESHAPINTHPRLVLAAYELFRKLGAAEVWIGEGPGHRRDAFGLCELAGYRETIPQFEDQFIDLNRDDVAAVKGFAGLPEFYFPTTALSADLIVSVAKMKTHHWAGVTLSMKNLFGLVPGSVYGWPKNPLHYIGIERSVVELNRTFRRTFAIVDGVVGMQGNGPIQGYPAHSGVIVMGRNPVAVDATCCRLMGVDPARIAYLNEQDLGNHHEDYIEQRGENPHALRQDYVLIDRYRDLRLA